MKGWTRRRAVAGLGATLCGGTLLRAVAAPREIEIVAQRFHFTPGEIPLQRGETVVLLLRALDFAHGFSVPELKLRADFVPGLVLRVELTPVKAGTLAFLCDNFCGDEHESMEGRFIVSA